MNTKAIQSMSICKKGLLCILLACLLLAFVLPAAAQAATIQIFLNGEKIETDVAPVLQQGRTLVPIRVISEKLGATVDYQESDKSIRITSATVNIQMTVGSQNVTVNGEAQTLDVPANTTNGRTLVPLRFVGEALGVGVDWDGANSYVILTKQVDMPQAQEPSADAKTIETQIVDIINQTRADIGLERLVLVDPLVQMARLHCNDMATNNFFSHESPSRGGLSARASISGLSGVGENLAAGYPTAQSIVDAWMASTPHRENILNAEARFIGVGVAIQNGNGTDGVYAVSEFIGGNGFMVVDRVNKLFSSSISISGFAVENTELIVYKLDPGDESRYTTRSSIAVQPDASGRFTVSVPLSESGVYLLAIGDDRYRVER